MSYARGLLFRFGVSLLLFSCSSRSQWNQQIITSQYDKFTYRKVSYKTPDPVHGLDLEFIKTSQQLKGYINIHSLISEECNESICIELKIDESISTYEAICLKGRQRLLLPQELTQSLIDAFSHEKTVVISIPGYRSIIGPKGFSKCFSKPKNPIENPFHLPF